MGSRQLLCAIAAPLALLGGCGSGAENQPAAPAGEEAAPAETPMETPAEVSAETQAASGAEAAVPQAETKSSVEAVASAAPASPAAAAPVVATPAAPPLAFMQCRSCHSVEPGKNGIGPSLAGIMGRTAGSAPGFNYSAALKESGITWNAQTLDQWMAGPMKMVPGTRMVTSIPEAPRREILHYLETLK